MMQVHTILYSADAHTIGDFAAARANGIAVDLAI
jgi:hypothetical protein